MAFVKNCRHNCPVFILCFGVTHRYTWRETGYENLVGMHIKDIPTRGASCEIFANDISFGKYEPNSTNSFFNIYFFIFYSVYKIVLSQGSFRFLAWNITVKMSSFCYHFVRSIRNDNKWTRFCVNVTVFKINF